MEEVTDPFILEQLNIPEPGEVTDPALLALLNAPKKEPGMAEAALRGGAQGATFGFSDELQAGVQALMEQGKGFKEAYEEAIGPIREQYEAAREAHPIKMEGGRGGGSRGAFPYRSREPCGKSRDHPRSGRHGGALCRWNDEGA